MVLILENKNGCVGFNFGKKKCPLLRREGRRDPLPASVSRYIGYHLIGFGKISTITVINIPIGIRSLYFPWYLDVNFLFNTHVLKLCEC